MVVNLLTGMVAAMAASHSTQQSDVIRARTQLYAVFLFWPKYWFGHPDFFGGCDEYFLQNQKYPGNV